MTKASAANGQINHICFITPEYLNLQTMLPLDGGLANYLCKISTALVMRGYNVSVICTEGAEDRVLDYKGVNVYFLKGKYQKTFLEKIKNLFSSKKKKQKIKSEILYYKIHKQIQEIHRQKKIDIIQYASYLAMGKYPEKNIPSCVRISSYAKLWQKYYNYENTQEIENEIIQFKNACFMYGPSKYIADYIKRDLALKADIQIIETPFVPYQGEENKELYVSLNNQIGKNPYLLFFGSLGLLKGAQEIADIIYEILDRYQNLYLVLVGKEMPIDGKSPVNMIKDNAKQYCDRVVYFNKTTHDKLFPLIKGSKAVLLPSRVDNLPNTCIEAMGLKKIVIGSQGASFEQLIDDEKSGLLCQAGNAESILIAVEKLMSLSDEQIKNMEQKAYERSLRLSPDVIVPQVLDYYQHVIQNWGQNEILN